MVIMFIKNFCDVKNYRWPISLTLNTRVQINSDCVWIIVCLCIVRRTSNMLHFYVGTTTKQIFRLCHRRLGRRHHHTKRTIHHKLSNVWLTFNSMHV